MRAYIQRLSPSFFPYVKSTKSELNLAGFLPEFAILQNKYWVSHSRAHSNVAFPTIVLY